MEAIILAGGFGTRLKSVVSDLPKPMADVCGMPFLNYILDELNYYGFTKAILCVSYLKEKIMDYYKNKYKNIEIIYSIETEPLGTGGAIKQALNYVTDDFVFTFNGDTMFKIDLLEMSKLNHIAIATKYMENFSRYGEVKISNDGIIESFEEKKEVLKGYINAGIYYIPKNIFSGFNLDKKFSIENDFFQKYMSKLNILAYKSDNYFIDIGIPEDYKKVQDDLKKKKALFLDRDGIINIDYGHVYKIEDFKFTDFIIPFVKKYYDLGYLIVVITNQAGIAKGLYTKDDYLKLNDYMINEFKKNGIEITKTYYCPHKDSDNCNCRKPKPGMYLKAIHDLNIDPDASISIGDKMSDLIASHEAGIKTIYYKQTNYEKEKLDFEYTEI